MYQTTLKQKALIFKSYPQFKPLNKKYIIFANIDIHECFIFFMVFADRYLSIYKV